MTFYRHDEILNFIYVPAGPAIDTFLRHDEILNAVYSLSDNALAVNIVGGASGSHLPISIMPVSGTWVLEGPLTISGSSVTIIGPYFVVTASQMFVSDNFITINSGESGSGVTLGYSGIEVDRGLDTNYVFLYRESDQTFRIGESGSTQPVATRQGTPYHAAYAFWNSASYAFETHEAHTVVTASYTVSASQEFISVSGSSAAVDIVISSSLLYPGRRFTVKDESKQSQIYKISIYSESPYLIANDTKLVINTPGTSVDLYTDDHQNLHIK